MSSTSKKLFLFDSASGQEVAEAKSNGLDVEFPAGIRWSDVLDCRIEPYTSRTLEENVAFAAGVHKAFILVKESQKSTASA